MAQYDATLQNEPLAEKRLNASMEARRMAKFIEDRRGFAGTLQDALQRGELSLRLMHGDPKVNNIMIDDFTGKGTAMIDLDTVSPGLIHYDFGDALRSTAIQQARRSRTSARWCLTSTSALRSARAT